MRDFYKPGRSGIWAENGVVATSHPVASQAALDILKSGGNAMDAAIAGAVLLGVCEPAMCGIGGDCFALVKPAGDGPVMAYNGSGQAPAGADAQALRDQGLTTIPADHAAAVTLPGSVQAMDRMSALWGKLGLADSLAPAIRYFAEGVPVHERVAYDWAESWSALKPSARPHYLPWGKPPAPGTRFALPKQAELLKRIAAEGASAFYEGEAAEDMLATLKAIGGAHEASDFAAVSGLEGDPIDGRYRGAKLLEHPPNGQGATAILLLNILARFDIAGMDPFGADRLHIEAEATKLAYDARNQLIADPRFAGDAAAKMTDPGFAASLADRIDPGRAMDLVPRQDGAPHRDTVYITVVDRDRMAVSLIYSIFHSFGSGHASDTFGILLHNRGTGFTLTPGHANEYGPGKRPMHTIIPGMLAEDGMTPNLPFGVMGGQYQATGHARFVTNLRDFGMTPQQAIDAPRSFAEKGVLRIEAAHDRQVAAALQQMGHVIEVTDKPIGGAQAIRIHPSGVLEAGSDPRKDGCALGH